MQGNELHIYYVSLSTWKIRTPKGSKPICLKHVFIFSYDCIVGCIFLPSLYSYEKCRNNGHHHFQIKIICIIRVKSEKFVTVCEVCHSGSL